MGDFRKLLPFVSLLLLAVLVPVQAAGCCKWSALLAWPHPAEKKGAAVEEDLAGGMAAGHACCRKPAPAAGDAGTAPAASDGPSGDGGCCLEAAGAAGPALASVPAAFADAPARFLPAPAGESPRVARLLPSRTTPEPAGPPPYLAHLRLLL